MKFDYFKKFLSEAYQEKPWTPSDLESTKKEAQKRSKEFGAAQHVEEIGNGKYKISDWYDSDSTVCSYENGRQL